MGTLQLFPEEIRKIELFLSSGLKVSENLLGVGNWVRNRTSTVIGRGLILPQVR